ncbi:protein kinase domain-containing protein [Calothrix sp. 336/3]|uniref:protein kinase domain-containing protein n=1 Tax=Calothrix sp. 336/3 TaxID=1337936 RepID=UPI0004E3CEF2|nr:protein kinase [Calothrix sp. 336/3]AKG22037.1 serine/threonine protein kinase [Calothrix sp. 336/3]
MIGQLLAGHYKVLEVLGEGGFGQTYIVEDIHLPGKPKCVLKYLKTTSTEPEVLETARRLFQKEAETLQQLGNHDQIPRLYAYFEEKQQFYLVQEFIDGHTLTKELLPGHCWTEKQVVDMLLEVLNILEFVHHQGVIHRDIKPDNLIRRASDRKLVLIDFGAIKQLRSQTVINANGKQNITLIVGTRGYMPSEQIRRLPRPSSDIYALGMMAIQAITGVYPHALQDDPNTGETLWQDRTNISPGLANILTNMTRYHFKERYQTASEVLAALQELIDAGEIPETDHQTVNLHQLTLEWHEEGEIKTRTIIEKQNSKNPGKIRIGRNPQECDIILPDPTISGLHVEIFFHSHKQKFYLRNLRQKNPPIVDGHMLLAGEMPLAVGSSLRLGLQNFKVSDISCEELPSGYTPMEYARSSALATLQPPPQTMRVSAVRRVVEIPTPEEIPPTPSQIILAPKKKTPSKVGLGIAGVFVSAIAGFFIFQFANSSTDNSQENFIAEQPQLCRIVAPAGGKYIAKLRPEPQTEIGALKQLNIGEKVMYLQAKGDFVQVKLADGTQGWIFGDEIQRCDTPAASYNRYPSN